MHLRHPAIGFGKNGYGAIVQRRGRCRRVIVEDHRDQRDREHQAGDDAKSQFEPHRKQRDLLADPLALPVAAIEIIRKYRQQRTEEQLKHGRAPRSWRHRPSRCGPWPRRLRQRASSSPTGGSVGSCSGGTPAIFSTDPAILRSGVLKSGRSIMARNRPIYPEQVVVREQRQQAQHGHDFKLELLRLVGHPLRQRVQVQIEIADRENGDDQENADADHQHIALARGGDEILADDGVRRDEVTRSRQSSRSQWTSTQ